MVRGATGSSATGIPRLARALRERLLLDVGPGGAPCIKSTSFPQEPWRNFVDNVLLIEDVSYRKLKARARQLVEENGKPDIAVVVGHSYGAAEALDLANSGGLGRAINLLILIDPFKVTEGTPYALKRGKARAALCVYTDQGPAKVRGAPVTGAQNLFMGDDVCPLTRCTQGRGHDFTHTNIDDCDWVQSLCFERIQALFPD